MVEKMACKKKILNKMKFNNKFTCKDIRLVTDLWQNVSSKYFFVGLIELTMSSNPKITEQSWIKLSVSMAASSCLHELYLDYNNIGDLAASSVLVGLASHRHLQVLDLEGTCITDRFAEVITVTNTYFFQNISLYIQI